MLKMGVLSKGMVFRVGDVHACWNNPNVSEAQTITFKAEE
jgi:hypothetical protein